MKLNEAQSLFKNLTLRPGPTNDLIAKPVGHLNLREAFEIYHRSYISRLTEALRSTFTAVSKAVGPEIFELVCKRYIETQPSVSYNLAAYGRNFPDFLQIHPATHPRPYLRDLAVFEWMYKNIFHAPTPHPLSPDRIRELTKAQDFRVNFVSAMDVFESPFSVLDIWEKRNEAAPLEDIRWDRPESLLIYKNGTRVLIKRIDTIEAQILKELQQGASISSALADYSTTLTPDRIAQLFEMMAEAGIVEDILVMEM